MFTQKFKTLLLCITVNRCMYRYVLNISEILLLLWCVQYTMCNTNYMNCNNNTTGMCPQSPKLVRTLHSLFTLTMITCLHITIFCEMTLAHNSSWSRHPNCTLSIRPIMLNFDEPVSQNLWSSLGKPVSPLVSAQRNRTLRHT